MRAPGSGAPTRSSTAGVSGPTTLSTASSSVASRGSTLDQNRIFSR